MDRKILLALALILAILLFAGSGFFWTGTTHEETESSGEGARETENVVGGQCVYKSFDGTCHVDSISENWTVAITYAAADDVVIEGVSWIDTPGNYRERQITQHLVGLGLPCIQGLETVYDEDLEKCGLEPGQTLNCSLALITSGTCSPEVIWLKE